MLYKNFLGRSAPAPGKKRREREGRGKEKGYGREGIGYTLDGPVDEIH